MTGLFQPALSSELPTGGFPCSTLFDTHLHFHFHLFKYIFTPPHHIPSDISEKLKVWKMFKVKNRVKYLHGTPRQIIEHFEWSTPTPSLFNDPNPQPPTLTQPHPTYHHHWRNCLIKHFRHLKFSSSSVEKVNVENVFIPVEVSWQVFSTSMYVVE